jgi:hypothetical protein
MLIFCQSEGEGLILVYSIASRSSSVTVFWKYYKKLNDSVSQRHPHTVVTNANIY